MSGGTAPETSTMTPKPTAAKIRPPLSARYICGVIERARPAAISLFATSFGVGAGQNRRVTAASFAVSGPTRRSLTLRRVSTSRCDCMP